MLTSSQFASVSAVFEKYGIPQKIWYPIMMKESSGNPLSLASTSKEISKGLFQINVKAHPQYANVDLFDPVTNAEIAAKTFIAPAYKYAQSVTSDEYSQALIVYSGLKNPEEVKNSYSRTDFISSGGIRPKWTSGVKDAFTKLYNNQAATSTTGTTTATNVSTNTDSGTVELLPSQSIAKFLLMLVLIFVIVGAAYILLKKSTAGQFIINTASKAKNQLMED